MIPTGEGFAKEIHARILADTWGGYNMTVKLHNAYETATKVIENPSYIDLEMRLNALSNLWLIRRDFPELASRSNAFLTKSNATLTNKDVIDSVILEHNDVVSPTELDFLSTVLAYRIDENYSHGKVVLDQPRRSTEDKPKFPSLFETKHVVVNILGQNFEKSTPLELIAVFRRFNKIKEEEAELKRRIQIQTVYAATDPDTSPMPAIALDPVAAR